MWVGNRGGAAIEVIGGGGSAGYYDGSPTFIVGNLIENNLLSGFLSGDTYYRSAVIDVGFGFPVILNNVVRNNAVGVGIGGAITIEAGSATIVQNLIYGNSSGCGGGALGLGNGSIPAAYSLLVANNTMYNNTGNGTASDTACFAAAQVYAGYETHGETTNVAFLNNIISGSTPYPAILCSNAHPASELLQPIFDHNLLFNAGGAFFGPGCVDVSAKYGNVALDPQFVDPVNGDLHLKPISPAIDAGNNSALVPVNVQLVYPVTPLTADLDGNPRQQDFTGKGYPVIDMGAYETAGLVDASATSIVVTSSSYSGNPGTSFALTARLASALGVPTGTAVFYLDGKVLGTAAINSNGAATISSGGTTIPAGVHSVYVTYAGQGKFTPAISIYILLNITPYSTSVSLVSSQNPSAPGQPVTFTVRVSSADRGYVPSPVTLSAGSAVLGTLLPDASGIATFTTSSLPPGSSVITASYAGDSLHAAASASLTQNNLDFTFTANPASLSLVTGHHTRFTLTATSIGGFAGVLRISVDPLPAHATLRLDQTTLTLVAGGQVSTSAYLDTDDVIGFLSSKRSEPGGPFAAVLCFPLVLFLRRRRGRIVLPLLVVLGAVVLASATGCSGKYPASTAPGNYTLRITASAQNGIAHTVEIPLVITQ